MEQSYQNLLIELAEYQKRYSKELITTHKFIDFVKKNPYCFYRESKIGHLTTSCFLVNNTKNSCLLLLHKKLNKWLQPGGHLDGECAQKAILREVQEETGLQNINFLQKEIFDLDIHLIPLYKNIKEHWHYDIRFLLQERSLQKIKKNSESKNIQWVKFEAIKNYTKEKSILRMLYKCL